ncbi:MAG: hypothetical protein NXI30_15845 [bacterium]|nr:hypothetical protein [bacterium]
MSNMNQSLQAVRSSGMAIPGPLIVGIDHSNILITAQNHSRQIGDPRPENLRLDIPNLVRLATAGRMLTYGVAVGSKIGSKSPIQSIYERSGFQAIFLERGLVTGREVGVDVTLASELQWCSFERTPGTVVLLTADGAGYGRGRGFFALLERMYQIGWSVELLAYEDSTHRAMADWARSMGQFRDLATFHESITFVPGRRYSTPLPQGGRRFETCMRPSAEQGSDYEDQLSPKSA